MGELKPGWMRVKFDQVVHLNRDKSKAPEADGLKRYVGLEHIEPGNLRVRTWGDVAKGTTFTNRFGPGQVLFGKRRAYQRKVAVVDFDGVCSGDIYVLEPKDPSVLLPKLLPFICQTDAFFEHAVATSAGSLSPRTNWKSLATYGFPLPKPALQQKLVVLLEAAREFVEAMKAVENKAGQALVSATKSAFNNPGKSRALQSLCRAPVTYGIVKAGDHLESGVPYLRVGDITTGPILPEQGVLFTSEEISNAFARTIVDENDLVIAVKASRGVVGQVRRIPGRLSGANMSRDVARIAPTPKLTSGYLYWALRSPTFMSEVQRFETGWKGDSLREITIGALRQLQVPWLRPERHKATVAVLDQAESRWLDAIEKTHRARALNRVIIETVLAGIA